MDFNLHLSESDPKSPSPKRRPVFTTRFQNPKQKRPYQSGPTVSHATSQYFTARVDHVSKDPPLVLRFANPRGMYLKMGI